jgi:hypothetical protein
VVAQQPSVDFTLHDLEPTARHVGFADGLYLLQSVLLAQLVERVVGLVQQLNQLLPFIQLHQLIEPLDITEHNSDHPLGITEVFLAFLDPGSDDTRHQNIQYLLRLLELLLFPEIDHKANLAGRLVPVSIKDQHNQEDKDVKDPEVSFHCVPVSNIVAIKIAKVKKAVAYHRYDTKERHHEEAV